MEKKLKFRLAVLVSHLFTLKYRLFSKERVKFGKNFIANWRFKITGPGTVAFGDNVNAWAHRESTGFSTLSKDAHIQIGNGCRLNGTAFQANKSIRLGDNCLVGSALLVDTDFHSTSPDRLTNPLAEIKSEPIEIGNNVWICGQCAILKGVHIGDRVIVGYGSVVVSNAPPRCNH